ncbi:ATP-binding protein [Microlunatus antarcticus]|uniref:Putative ATPase n=1 Tax=Microlunatus antarcticus TaxID=53388 RepID=A0A7W5JRS6_9ACTN|nr:putative ATPase [Microlunatus antarcticus]
MTAVAEAGTASPISTPDRRLRIFVSSTLQELADERRAVQGVITQLRLTPVMFELGARPHPPRDLYRAYLAQSDVFVGVYAGSYGWVAPDEEVSGLEDEYRLSGDLPKLIYVKSGVEQQPRLKELLNRIRGDDDASYKRFTTADELAGLLGDDLAVLLTERFTASRLAADPVVEPLRPGRVPVPPTPLVGRADEVQEVLDLLADPGVRLVSLVGPGGIGKTRMALQAGLLAPGIHEDAVWFVDLASVHDRAGVVDAVAAAFGVRREGTRPLLDVLVDRLVDRDVLLILDNFEQVLDAAPDLARLLDGCARLKVLVTTRTVLGLRGEHVVSVAPLVLTAAVELFVARARQVRPGFRLTPANEGAVADLCLLLDGIPLALELAAAQLRVRTPAALLERLRQRLDRSLDLSVDLADLPSRQRTLRATLDWSHSLLGESQRTLLARLSVFSARWTLEGAEAVGVSDEDVDVDETLAALVAASLVVLDESDAEQLRFRLLSPVRSFAAGRLLESGERDATLGRLTTYLVDLVETAGPGLLGPDNRAWAEQIDACRDDLLAATARAVDADDAETVVRIAAPLFPYWWSRGMLLQLSEVAERAAALPSAAGLAMLPHASLLWARGMFRISKGQLADAEPLLDALLERLQGPGVERLRAFALAGLALARVRTTPTERSALVGTAVGTFRDLDDGWGLTFALSVQGQLALASGDLAGATRIHTEALGVARRIGSDYLEVQLLDLLGVGALVAGDPVAARVSLVAAARLHQRLADSEGSANCLGGFAAVALMQGRSQVAAELMGVAARTRELVGVTIWPALQPSAAQLELAITSALPGADLDAALARGRAMPMLQGLAYAVDATA